MDDDQSGAVPVRHTDGVREGALAGHGAVEADHDTMPEGGIAGRARLSDRLRLRPGVGYLLAVCGFRDFVTGHRCLGEESPREESGLEVYLRAMELCPGNIFPTPTPKGTAPLLHCPALAQRMRRWREHAGERPGMAMPVASYIQLVDARTGSRHSVRTTLARLRPDGRMHYPTARPGTSRPAIMQLHNVDLGGRTASRGP